MVEKRANFYVGQLVRHQLFGYRGVVASIDPVFSLTEDWYDKVAKSRPPKDAPWYHVLPHNAEHMTYVAERNLAADESNEPVEHPLVSTLLGEFTGDRYQSLENVH